ncbi:MAG: hypothetical protein RL213_1110 [Bacteroidota bacterium]
MTLHFSKYQGCGNDFILVDARSSVPALSREQIAALCDRRYGIGADGLILLCDETGFDFRMVYFNSDGGLSSMCGNGGRCITAFAVRCGIEGTHFRFLAADGPHESHLLADGTVSLGMKDVAAVTERGGKIFTDTGSPHVVVPVEGLADYDVYRHGRAIRQSGPFLSEGANVNFVETSDDGIFVRTFERGVEDETLSCGTGVTAAALVAADRGWISGEAGECSVRTRGGDLRVKFTRKGDGFTEVRLEGPAVHVFDGSITL